MTVDRGVGVAIAGALAGLLILSVALDSRLAQLEADVAAQAETIAGIVDVLQRHELARSLGLSTWAARRSRRPSWRRATAPARTSSAPPGGPPASAVIGRPGDPADQHPRPS